MSAVHPVQTIERTSKRWKLLQAASVLALLVGILLLFGSEADGVVALGGVLAGLGIGGYTYAKVGAWWENG